MNIDQARSTFRQADRAAYPELDGYTREQIYRELGPGGLYMVIRVVRTMSLQPGDIVLDLGCGHGESAIFLAQHFKVRVVAVDLWTPATTLSDRFAARGYRGQITPLHLDARKELPSRRRRADGGTDRIRVRTQSPPDHVCDLGAKALI
jgi:protein-L-isoaspartate O-methyltransferase